MNEKIWGACQETCSREMRHRGNCLKTGQATHAGLKKAKPGYDANPDCHLPAGSVMKTNTYNNVLLIKSEDKQRHRLSRIPGRKKHTLQRQRNTGMPPTVLTCHLGASTVHTVDIPLRRSF